MESKLHYNTIKPLLLSVIKTLMASKEKMFALHKERYPYNHDQMQIRSSFSNFILADEDFDPICLKGKHWEIIKLDMIDFAKQLRNV